MEIYSLFVCENRNPLTCTFIRPGMSCGQLYLQSHLFIVTFVLEVELKEIEEKYDNAGTIPERKEDRKEI